MPKFNDKLLDELLKDYDYSNPNPDLIKKFRKKMNDNDSKLENGTQSISYFI